ncbi:hypothetical protein SCHPADRAFT_946941 [Schizopora paradoxa]|uniref:BTB domain-containing protein n=1 Tax=Schizopora paradoxa TaxID=27342 RepID=A0A0H2R7I8_9AGAM|nr:hypothetical protein SCHPADRAFT_946941 [Schizopora paradoxa]
MPPKRPRLSEDSQTEDGGEQQGNPTTASTGPRPHEEVWFSDGSIVLATDVHLYRVHKGMLAKYSRVLSDMFEFPTGNGNTDCWEGVPIVRMVGDSDKEISLLLKALYGMNLRDALREMALSEVTSLLSISSKYDFQDVRSDVVHHLQSLLPSTLEKYQASRIHEGVLVPRQLFDLLLAAVRCDVPLIIPALSYLCARIPLPRTVSLLHELPNECMERFLLGRDWLCGVSQIILKRSLRVTKTRRCGSSRCLEGFRALVEEKFPNNGPRFIFIFDVPERGILEGIRLEDREICGECAEKYTKMLKSSKNRVWNSLSKAFSLKTWKELGRSEPMGD